MNYPEALIVWYLRFNGYFTIANFTTHPDSKKSRGNSEADILAVRFQHSDEYQRRFEFERDPALVSQAPIDFIIAEVKSSRCELNPNWTTRDYQNVEYALRWMGRWREPAVVDQIANEIYASGQWVEAETSEVVRFVCFGETTNDQIYPAVSQIPLGHVLGFMRSRMTKGCPQTQRENWGPFMKELGESFATNQTDEQILDWITGRTRQAEWVCEFKNQGALHELNRRLTESDAPDEFRRWEKIVGRINGLRVEIFANEHPPPHFRVRCGDETADYSIKDCEQLTGGLLRRYRVIRGWHSENKDKLVATWNAFRPSDCPVGQYMEV